MKWIQPTENQQTNTQWLRHLSVGADAIFSSLKEKPQMNRSTVQEIRNSSLQKPRERFSYLPISIPSHVDDR